MHLFEVPYCDRRGDLSNVPMIEIHTSKTVNLDRVQAISKGRWDNRLQDFWAVLEFDAGATLEVEILYKDMIKIWEQESMHHATK